MGQDFIEDETYANRQIQVHGHAFQYFSAKIQKTPNPSADAIRTALDMMSDQFPQAKSVDPNEVIDLSFIK